VSAARPWRLALGGLAALAAAMGIGRFVYTPILPPMAEALALTKAQAGLLASANFAGYLAGALAASSPRLAGSRRAWLLGALAASALTTGAVGLFAAQAALLALRFAGGAASALVLVFASALVLERLAAAGRSDLSAVHFAGVGAGIALSAVLVSSLLACGAGWRMLWLASGLVSLVAAFAAVFLVPEGPEHKTSSEHASAGSQPGLRALVVAYGLFGFGYIITATFIVDMVRGSAATRALEPWVWTIVGVTAVPSVAFWTLAARRVGVLRAFSIASVAEAIGVAASVLWSGIAGMLLAAALLGGTFMGLTALGLVAARQLAPGNPQRALAVMTASFGTGQIVGPVFAGIVYDSAKSFLPSSLTAATALLVAAILVSVRRGASAA
jgi:predicted MFS family arabinose efflux permease